MFAWWGRIVYRYRFIVIGVMVALCLGGGLFGLSLGSHVTQSGFYDDGSQSVKASVLGDQVYGRDTTGHIVAVYTAPAGKTVDDPQFIGKVRDSLAKVAKDHPDQILRSVGYFTNPELLPNMATADKKHAFMSIQLKGNDDDTILNNYKKVEGDFAISGVNVQVAGLEPVANALTGTIATDQKRMEVLALPLVAIVLFFVFGGVVAACLPVMVGGLSIAGALGILRFIAIFGPVHYFAQPVVSLIGLGIAIDYGLFVVSRFREEIAEGYDTEAAVRRTVMTAGRTVTFSAVIIVASGAGLLLLPQGFVKSLTYALIAAVTLAALLSITLLPACLAILGRNVDALGVRTLLRVPFLRNWKPSRVYLTWLAERLQKTKTREEVEAGFWGKLVNWVMRRPLAFAIPIAVAMILLVIPLGRLALGGMSEKYLPPDNPVRQAQEQFDKLFPGYRNQPLTLVVQSSAHHPVTDQQLADIKSKALSINGFIEPDNNPVKMWAERACLDGATHPCQTNGKPKDPSVRVIQNGLTNATDAAKKISELRAITAPKGLNVLVGGAPALEQDSIHSIFAKMPLFLVVLITTTTLLMFLAFGSLVLPFKAAVTNALTIGATMGILTWIFVDGHFSKMLNFTATPLTAPVIALVVAVGYGLATDYEVFLVSRMVEARENGMSTAEAIRIGTATTGRLITAAALILAVVAGSFVFSDLVIMKYLAFGLMAALLLDATVVRMFLVPSVMKLLGDDCWWAPRWMKRLQIRLGLGEIYLPDERKRPIARGSADRPAIAGRTPAALKPRPPHDPTHPAVPAPPRPRPTGRSEVSPPAQDTPSRARTKRMPVASEPEPTTNRLPAPTNAATNGPPLTSRTPKTAPPPREREIESWLGELRGGPKPDDPAADVPRHKGAPPKPSAEETHRMPAPAGHSADRNRPADGAGVPGDAEAGTAAIPVPPQDDSDAEAATEKLSTPVKDGNGGEKPPRQRRGGGLSAQDLLRREGRF